MTVTNRTFLGMTCVVLLSCTFGDNPGSESQLLLLPLTMTDTERASAEQRADLYRTRLREFSQGTHGDARSVKENEEKFLKAAYQLTTPEERSMAVATMREGGLISDEGKEALDAKLGSEEEFVQAFSEGADGLDSLFALEMKGVRANQ